MANEEKTKSGRLKGRRKQAAIAAAGAAVAISGAAFFATQSSHEEEQVSLPQQGFTTSAAEAPAAQAQAPGAPAPGAPAPAGTSAEQPAGAKETPKIGPTMEQEPSLDPKVQASKDRETRKRIKEAREAAAKDGVKIQRARTPEEDVVPAADVKVVKAESSGSGIVRVVTAKGDLSGQREMLWAADKGKKIGQASCTQKFRFSNEAAPQERDTMLLCWRTSASRSVITVALSQKGRPSAEASVAEIARQWDKLG